MESLSEDIKSTILALLEEAYKGRGNNLLHSIELAEKALALSRESNHTPLIAKSLTELALFVMIQGEYDKSTKMSEEAIKLYEKLGDDRGVAEAKYNIAGIYYRTNNYHMGLVLMIDCRSIYLKYDDFHNLSRIEKSLGTIYEYFGDIKNAVKSYESAIENAKKAGDLNLKSNAYNPLSGIYLKQDEIEKAREMIERSIAIKKQTGDVRGLAFAIYGRGKVYTKMGRYDEAEKDFFEALRIHDEVGDRLGMGMTYNKLGILYTEMGENEKAKEILETGLEYSTKYNTVIIKFRCSYQLYQIYKSEGNDIKALENLENYFHEKEAVINTQTLKIIENYELITRVESLEKEAQMQREKAEIIEKKNRAEEAARIKQEFLSTMSHEIRTPLNAVTTITALLGETAEGEEKKLIDSLQFSANNLLRIINDILDFTKLDLGKVQLDIRPAHFLQLLENIRSTYENVAKEKGIGLLLTVGEGVAESYDLDETKLLQILGNLISNAIKFTDEGSVNLTVEKLKDEHFKDILRFKVNDTGIGIPKNNQEEIFESFSQPKSITTKKHGGSGLGLAIVKKLVALYGSEVHVESEPGHGATFYFDLKLKKTHVPKTTPRQISDELKDKTVLLAEDNMINAMVAIKLLSNWGMTTDHAENGVKVVEMSKQKPYNFILMDIHMPEMNGFDATKHIRLNDSPNTKTPIFALTADTTAEHEEKYTHYFNGFLSKPIELDKLYEALITSIS